MLEIESTLSIQNALALEAEGESPCFAEGQHFYVVQPPDLLKMAQMGLGELPVDAIGIPDFSPVFQDERLKLKHTLDISHRLTQFFPGYFVAALYELQSMLNKAGFSAYVIGGIPRDLLLSGERNLEIQDVDITVEGDALHCARYIVENSRNFFMDESYPEFGTAKIHYKDTLQFDLASTRKEIYRHCGALPEVTERGVPLANDVIRRDFTVNALALSINQLGTVLDHANGIQDVGNRLIRVLHPASFFEDPSRILRALKFAARLDFSLSPGTRRLLEKFLQYGDRVYKGGGERIKDELREFLSIAESPAKRAWLGFFIESGCQKLLNMHLEDGGYPASTEIQPLPPSFVDAHALWLEASARLPALVESLDDKTLGGQLPSDFAWEVYLCLLFAGLDVAGVTETVSRLGLTKAQRTAVERFLALRESRALETLQDFASPVAIHGVLHEVPLSSAVSALISLAQAQPSRFRGVLDALLLYKRKWEKVRLELDGKDLMVLGVPPGKTVGLVLRELLHAKLSGRLSSRLDEVRFVQNWLLEAREVSPSPVDGSVALSPDTNPEVREAGLG